VFDRYWKIAIVLTIVSFCGCILIGTLVFMRHTESTREHTRLKPFGIGQDPVAEYKAAIGTIISKVEKLLLIYCLTIIAGFFLSILLFLFINK
jgi:predicted small integral membrane protein